MNKREFLRSKGFTVGERGRFSAEMLAAIAAAPAGAITEEVKATPKPRTPKVVVTAPTQASAQTAPAVTNLPRVREDKVMWAVSPNPGSRSHVAIAYDVCQRCTNSVRVCPCKAGPKPPAGAIPVASYAEAKSL